MSVLIGVLVLDSHTTDSSAKPQRLPWSQMQCHTITLNVCDAAVTTQGLMYMRSLFMLTTMEVL